MNRCKDRCQILLLLLGGASTLGACGHPSRMPPAAAVASPAAPDSFVAEFRTSRGTFRAAFHRSWSPRAVDRVHDLIQRRFWDDIRIFRVVQNFVAQFGISNDSAANAAWRSQGVEDEPVTQPNRAGRISFARGGPRTRTIQLFINLRDNTPRLDTLQAGRVTGYPPVGEVVQGWHVVELLNAEYGNAPSQSQDSIGRQGNAFLDRRYPRLDRILSVRVVQRWGGR